MSIKLAILKSGEQLIADAKELVSDEKVRGYLLTKPHKVVSSQPLLLTEEQKDSHTHYIWNESGQSWELNTA